MTFALSLSELLRQAGLKYLGESLPELTISHLVQDSRELSDLLSTSPGAAALFIGRDAFIADALAAGAVAAISIVPLENCSDQAKIVLIENRDAWAWHLASAFYGGQQESNQSPLSLFGVTGTNGKTTVAYLLHYLFSHGDKPTGLISTVDYCVGKNSYAASQTTPGAVKLASLFREMRDKNCEQALMEVSSHALDQWRISPDAFDCAILTNISRDHLDYHGSMDDYVQAKQRLFKGLSKNATMIVNGDDYWADQFCADTSAKTVLRYGFKNDLDLCARIIKQTCDGMVLEFEYEEQTILIESPLLGEFNVYNLMAGFLGAISAGINIEKIIPLLAKFNGAPGRLERVHGVGSGKSLPTVYVDYAHTDHALENVLKTLKPLVKGRLITVFGCGGDRDTGKRPLMASVAATWSDCCFITSDNPRSENPQAIVDDVVAGFAQVENQSEGRDYFCELDRRVAIQSALSMAGADDFVLIAGKGHEKAQEINGEYFSFDDVAIAGALLTEKAGA